MMTMVGWLAATMAWAAPCPSEGGPGCVERGTRAAERDRNERSERWFRRACTATHPETCGPLAATDHDAALATLAQAWDRCTADDDTACRRYAAARGPEGARPLRDYDAAVMAVHHACERSDGAACVTLADWLGSVDPDRAYDAAGARHALKRGCDTEHGPACSALAWMRVTGAGGAVDGPGALEAMDQACALEAEEACVTSARWWMVGRGVDVDATHSLASWTRACAIDADDCVSAARYVLDDAPAADDSALRNTVRSQCVEQEPAACGAVLMLGMDGLAPLEGDQMRNQAYALACDAAHVASCEALAGMAEEPVASQIRLEAKRHAIRQGPERPVGPDTVPGPAATDLTEVETCVAEVIEGLTVPTNAGRHSPSPGQDHAAAWLGQRFQRLGLEVQRQPVDVRRRGQSWVEVRGVRYPARSAVGAASGTFSGTVHILDGVPGPTDIPADAEAVLVAVGRLDAASAPAVIADVPVLAVHRNVARLARGQSVHGVALAPRRATTSYNVVGVLPGKGPLADESIVVGGHYDAQGSDFDGSYRPGADDNASGTAGTACIAEALVDAVRDLTTHRTFVFVGFSGEELGLYGSRAYIWNPVRPNPVGMINLDMIGRVRANEIQARIWGQGWYARIGTLAAASPLRVVETPDTQGSSDHFPFALNGVPAVHFFSGTHGDYHRPTDTFDRVNVQGAAQVTALATDLAVQLADGPTELGPIEDPCTELTVGALGVGLGGDFLEGFRIRRVRCVAPDSAGEALGVQPGDQLRGLDSFRKAWPHEHATLHVLRGTECMALEVGKEPRAVPCESIPD